MSNVEKVIVTEEKINCDGGILGHPKVYLNIGKKGSVECPYCGKNFILKKDKKIE